MQRSRLFSISVLTLCLSCSRAKPTQRTKAAPLVSESVPTASAHVDPEPTAALSEISGSALLQQIKSSGKRAVIVSAWATWCLPCREELPQLAQLAPKLAVQGASIWLVSVDEPSAFVVANALLDSLHIPLRRFGAAPPLEAFEAALDPNWRGTIPASFLFDGSGMLRYAWAGEVDERELQAVVARVLAGQPSDGHSASDRSAQ